MKGDYCVREIGFLLSRKLIGGTVVWFGPMERWGPDRTFAHLFATRHEAHRSAREQRTRASYDGVTIRVVRLMVRVPE